MPKMHSVRLQIRDREDIFNLVSNAVGNILTEKDGGFVKIRALTRLLAKFIENVPDYLCFFQRGLAT
jgi:hypothetical protein